MLTEKLKALFTQSYKAMGASMGRGREEGDGQRDGKRGRKREGGVSICTRITLAK